MIINGVNYICVDEASCLIGYTKATIRKKARDGSIQAFKRGKKWFFIKEDLINLLKEYKVLSPKERSRENEK
jgi:excisionase family DNA binding protein